MNIQEFDFDPSLTPPQIFAAVREVFDTPCVLLESMSFDEKNKMSLIASCPVQEIITFKDSFDRIEKALKKTQKLESDISHFPFAGGLIGYFNFEILGEIEPQLSRESHVPHALFYEFSRFVFFDHERRKIVFMTRKDEPDFEITNKKLLSRAKEIPAKNIDPAELKSPELADFSPFISEQTESTFSEKVQYAKEQILNGEVFQMIVSNEFQKNVGTRDGLEFYEVLRAIEPTTHLYLLDFGEHGQVVGASPEILGSKRETHVLYRPIAGTRFRGRTDEEDQKILQEMCNDPKENAEHDMLVDLGRNDLGKICKTGTVRIVREKYGKFFANVMHLITDIAGEIEDDMNSVDFFKAIQPAGTLTGAPKLRAIELIQKLETHPRDIYGGAVGYFSADGNMEFAIAIRTFFLQNSIARFRVGAGIVQDSVPHKEWLEVHNKAKTLVKIFNFLENAEK